MIKEDERLNKVRIAKTKKIRKDANDVAQKEYIYIYICVCVCVCVYVYLCMYVCINIVCGFRLFIDFIV